MRFSRRLDRLPPYLFVEISRKIAEKRARGIRVVSFAIGDPDLPTPAPVIDALVEAARDPANHRYPETEGLPELRQAIANWYRRRFGVELDPDAEVLPLIGSKEGIAHIALCFIDPGDIALVPDPGYPVYAMGTVLAGGEPYYLPLREENGFLPDLDEVPPEVAGRAKLLWINYPNNPTGAVAELDFFQRVVEFARRHGLAVCHDAPYTEVAFDGYRPPSFLQAAGAKEVGVEFHSLSKTFCMTGWRIGFVCGNAQVIGALAKLKTNLDSGVFVAIQRAAEVALEGPTEPVMERVRVYQARRDAATSALQEAGWRVERPRATFYLWAEVPEGFDSLSFAAHVLERTGVILAPGIGYGEQGARYVRLSITVPDDRLHEALRRLRALS